MIEKNRQNVFWRFFFEVSTIDLAKEHQPSSCFRNIVPMAWFILLLAGFLEVAFAFCLGKARTLVAPQSWYWYSGFVLCLVGSMLLLIKATQTLPIGTAYAVWMGIGALGTVLMGMIFFNEPATFWRLFFLTSLIVSILGLKVVS